MRGVGFLKEALIVWFGVENGDSHGVSLVLSLAGAAREVLRSSELDIKQPRLRFKALNCKSETYRSLALEPRHRARPTPRSATNLITEIFLTVRFSRIDRRSQGRV